MFTFGLLECHKCFLFSNISWLDSLDYIYILLYMYICFMCVYLAWLSRINFGTLGDYYIIFWRKDMVRNG